MSGIIHLNGKDYDEDGNLIKPKRTSMKYVDGIANINKPAVKQIQQPTQKASEPVLKQDIQPRKAQELPHAKLQKSTTLNRFAVKKPQKNHDIKPSLNLIVKNKKPATLYEILVPKNPSVQRVAKTPSYSVKNEANESHQNSVFVPIKKTEEMIQAQLEAATAHLMTFKKPNIFHHVKKHYKALPKHHRRFVFSSSTLAMTLLIIGGFIYMNLPGISIVLASRKAGFTAHIPSFTPNGYSIINPIGYTPGRVVVKFKSNTNDLKYAIEQKPTGWTSETLREQVVSSSGSQYQTQYAKGLTIFFTSEDTATWVDRGILFTFQGNSGLSVDQIASIAASM